MSFKQPMPSLMKPQHRFSTVPRADIPRSRFNRSHGYKTTLNSSFIYPVYLDEVLPGDTFTMKPTMLARMATPMFPIMDNLYLDTFFFFVPYRLLWTNWKRFMGERTPNTDSSIDFLIPQYVPNGSGQKFEEGTLADYFGFPVERTNTPTVSVLPFAAYQLIWREWFRDQNLINIPATLANIPVSDGPHTANQFNLLRKRGKRHDYFTSALPFPQKGPAVSLPLGTSAPVLGNGQSSPIVFNRGPAGPEGQLISNATGDIQFSIGGSGFDDALRWANPNLHADLSSATAATINALREAFQMQRFLERDARGGTRYTEIVLSHFGVQSPDSRLQRPEYLGGGSTPINIAPIPASAETENSEDSNLRHVGDLGAVGMTVSRNGAWTKSFTEHGIVMGLVNIRADLTYQKGILREWSRRTRYDFYWPVFAHLGEQAILNKEIYVQGTTADEEIFGYQERYAEYRYKPSMITGKFRSDATGSLDVWHLSQDFNSLPVLGETFIEENVPIDRVVAVPSEPQFLLDCYFELNCARPMPTFSVPGLIDHF